MKLLSRIWFPAALTAVAVSAAAGAGSDPVHTRYIPEPSEMADTVVYPQAGYKLHRVGDFQSDLADSTTTDNDSAYLAVSDADTLPKILARDTIKVPDSLRLTDPFRFKYYIALVDSLTHAQVRDSLRKRVDSLHARVDSLKLSLPEVLSLPDSESFRRDSLLSRLDSAGLHRDSLLARLDSLDWKKLDSIYFADSTAKARAIFLAWFNSLSKQEQRKYLIEKRSAEKYALKDSVRKVKEEKQIVRDSIIENTPRILETFALADSMCYKRLVEWRVDPDFQKLDIFQPDTTYNYRFYDYPYLRKDVNATWLGVAGSALQTYDVTKRKGNSGVDFYEAFEAWTYSHNTLPFYNTKTPYTELSYTGTLAAADSKVSHNLHLFTTQNILPELNFSLLFDRFSGSGMLENEKTINRTSAVQLNYLGKKYMGHLGYIHNSVNQNENGGMTDNYWIRDTVVEARDIPVNLTSARSAVNRHTVFLDQQFRIPFNFINEIKARKDSTFKYSADSLDKNITTAFVGHSSEFSSYSRAYSDEISDAAGRTYYNQVFNYNLQNSNDSLGMWKLDNKVFLRLQPWAADAIVSKLDVGVGDYLKQYAVEDSLSGSSGPVFSNQLQNSFYLYAGVEGQYKKYLSWDAKADYVLIGHDVADFGAQANAKLSLYPFRRARNSPLSVNVHFETSLREPELYKQRMYSNHFSWNNDFGKESTTMIKGGIDIPRWRTSAEVGYTLMANKVYYDGSSIARQSVDPVNVLTASVRNDLKLGPLHLDNRALLQFSSDQSVVPVPMLALNMKWFLQFVVQRDPSKTHTIMEMQVGINAFYNTQWYSPAYNPNIGVFYNQQERLYENGPYFDIFVNIQWKRCCLFVKYQNMGKGWPMKNPDYFSADNHIITQDGMEGLKIGIFWPFYIQPK